MPLQNRVTPFGEIIATPARGMFTGNRGIIHDPETRTLLKKRWSLKCWLICQLEYKHFHRVPMARRSWTELFFLDEATALAAGHRPCFYCSRDRVEAFRTAWAEGNGGPILVAAEDTAFMIVQGRPLRWTPFGYESVDKAPRTEGQLTPPSTLAALRAGYR